MATKEEKILKAEERKVFGKKLKKERSQGKIPANIFGKDISSQSIFVNEIDFLKIYKKVGQTEILHLIIGKEKLPVLINQIHFHSVTRKILHVDFRKLDLSKKIEVEVPIKIINESEIVKQQLGVLLIQKEKIAIESLPTDIPKAIEVDISVLKNIGEAITVEQLAKNTKYIIKENPKSVIVSIVAHKEEKIEQAAVPTPTEELPVEKTKEKEQEKEQTPNKQTQVNEKQE